MNRSSRLLALMLLLAVALGSVQPAVAEADWRALYLNVLKQNAGKKQMVALADLDRDGTPEMAVIAIDGTKGATVTAYTVEGGAAVQMTSSDSDALNLGAFALKGVKSAGIQLRASAAKASFSIALTAKSGNEAIAQRIALTHAGGRKLAPELVARKSGSTYYVGGAQTTQAKHQQAIRSYESAYKKKGTLPTVTIGASGGAAAIESKFQALVKRYNNYAGVKKVQLSKSAATLSAGDTLALTAKLTPATALSTALAWTSSDAAVAAVDQSGVVTAKSAGTAQITATAASGAKQSMKLTVKGGATGGTITGVSLDEPALTMVKGATHTLEATIAPAGATGALSWSSSAPAVASVSAGKVTAHKVGKAVITVKTPNGKTATCKVVVNETGAVIVDISQHNYSTKMDWAKIAKNVDLLILRCGVTRTETAPIGVGIDARFAYYAKQCQAYNIPFGVYFYGKCSDVETAKKEAQLTWETASPYNPLFYVYDVEETRLTKALIETYMTTLKSLGAKKTGYYIAHHLYSKYKLDTSLVDFIWLPHYGKNTGKLNSTPSYNCDIHQYTSQGKIDGFPGVVDVNRLMGTKSLQWFLKR